MKKQKAVFLNKQDKLTIIDQTKLPNQLIFRELEDKKALIEAIANLRVRGAPIIGITAAYGVYILAKKYEGLIFSESFALLKKDIDQLRDVRPTAFNLIWALRRMEKQLYINKEDSWLNIISALREEATLIDCENTIISQSIAKHGLHLIQDKMNLLTHCNAGWLAAGGIGTALAPIYLAFKQGRRLRVYCEETRPLLQGMRLTTYELLSAGIPTTLICDNMTAFLMAHGEIDLILVGADRIAKNGDVANKIGTLSLAINANYFKIPFYVCAPSSTFDPETPTGKDIIIEQRDSDEITKKWFIHPMAPTNVDIYNPAFDVTPYSLISGVITENGINRYR